MARNERLPQKVLIAMISPVILDFDRSTGHVPEAIVIDLAAWQDEIRYGCSMKAFKRLDSLLERVMPSEYGTVLLGSGDFHHVSALLVERACNKLAPSASLELVILDNHPDNMRFPFGIHCGSWVSHAAKLDRVSHIHVLGITSGDVGLAHAWENRLGALYKGKLTYWCMDVNVGWAKTVGLARAIRYFDSPAEMVDAFVENQNDKQSPVYLSIDKDAFSEETVCTNWDQGRMTEPDLYRIVDTVKPRLLAGDINGEVSNWTYQSRWKRCLSWLDGQEPVPEAQLLAWQQQQHEFNSRVLAALNR